MRTPIDLLPGSVGSSARILAVVSALLGFSQLTSADDSRPTTDFGRTVELPPFLVTDHASAKTGIKWRYTEIPGFVRAISCCNDYITEQFVGKYYQQEMLVRKMVPVGLQVHDAVPVTLVLFDAKAKKVMAEEMVSEMETMAKHSAQVSGLSQLPQKIFHDRESTTSVFILESDDYSHLRITKDRVQYLLDAHLPLLPSWYRFGVLNLFAGTTGWEDGGEVTLPCPLMYLGSRATDTMSGHKQLEDLSYTLLPMQELFSVPPSIGKADTNPMSYAGRWQRQVDLFLHWVFESPDRTAALDKFVARGAVEPVTEGLFRECFGEGFNGAADDLVHYLVVIQGSPWVVLARVNSVEIPQLEIRDATEDEVACIQGGDLGRKEINYVANIAPAYAQSYISQVGAILSEAEIRASEGNRRLDSDLQSVTGLYYYDIAAYNKARPLLEAAVKAHSPRPSVYISLAWLIHRDAQERPAGVDGKLAPAQVAAILGPIRENPLSIAQMRTLDLVASTLDQAADPPSKDDLDLLEGGIDYFPHDSGLMLATAKLCARSSLNAEALKLVDRGEKYTVPGSKAHDEYLKLRAELAGKSAQSP